MNLVAKEFVAAQVEGTGALLLSRFAGAAEEMSGAVIINPYDAGGMARAIKAALEMSPRERRVRLAAMQRQVHSHTIYDWVRAVFTDVERVRKGRTR
jgi:trehalose 6-phosphate synthase